MPTFNSITPEAHGFLQLPKMKWFPEAVNHSGLVKGGIYLLSGPPGVGKTTIALEMAIDLASYGTKVLYVALEQSPSDLKNIMEKRIFPHRRAMLKCKPKGAKEWKEGLKQMGKQIGEDTDSKVEEERILQNLLVDSTVSGMESLPDFLTRQVLSEHAQYNGVRLIIVDSLQGLGTAPTSSRPYAQLYNFNRWAKDSNITVILVGHITKGGAIAGPRSLEHNVDCVLYMRRAMRLRPLFVPKNRFGAERYEPMSLIMNKWGCLEKSPHMQAHASKVFSFLPGRTELVEVQALVKLPKFGTKAGIVAPYLPRQKLGQLIGIVSNMKDIDISDLTFEINCSLPGGSTYYLTLDLPLILSMLSSYFQKPVPSGSLFLGEVDLAQEIRTLPAIITGADLSNAINSNSSPIGKIFVAQKSKNALAQDLRTNGWNGEVHGVDNMETLIREIWPDTFES